MVCSVNKILKKKPLLPTLIRGGGLGAQPPLKICDYVSLSYQSSAIDIGQLSNTYSICKVGFDHHLEFVTIFLFSKQYYWVMI